jgi:hypothetical protein
VVAAIAMRGERLVAHVELIGEDAHFEGAFSWFSAMERSFRLAVMYRMRRRRLPIQARVEQKPMRSQTSA